MKIPWLTISGRSPQAPASSACFSLRTLATAVLEGLSEHQLADVLELLRLEADGGTDGGGGFLRPNHVAAEQARDAGLSERVSGPLGLATAELGEAVAIEVGERLLATMGVVGRLAVAEEQGSLGHFEIRLTGWRSRVRRRRARCRPACRGAGWRMRSRRAAAGARRG